jgi:alkylhydroperoxidase family enzyme
MTEPKTEDVLKAITKHMEVLQRTRQSTFRYHMLRASVRAGVLSPEDKELVKDVMRRYN